MKNCFHKLGLRIANLHYTLPEAWNEEHMIDINAAQILLPMGGWVFQQHMRAIGRNALLLKMHGVKPIVTYRNLFDCIVSWCESRDHDVAVGRGNQYIFAPIHCPDWSNMSMEAKYAWATYNVTSWYFSFYVSWKEADIPTLFVNYEQHFKNEALSFDKMLRWAGIDHKATLANLATIASETKGKFNVGQSGRGMRLLPFELIDSIYTQAEAWGPRWGPILQEALLNE